VNIWLALWIVLSLTLMGFLAWTLLISYKQKRAWKAFAARHKLRYASGRMMQSPEMDGLIEDYRFSFFTSEHNSPDARTSRKLATVEIMLGSALPIEGGVASGSMIPVLKALDLKFEITPAGEGWSKAYLAACSNRAAMEAYMTPERVQILSKLMQMAHVWVIFVFRNGLTLLRIDTPSPLDTDEQLEKLSKILIRSAKILELKSGESQLLKAEEAKAPLVERALAVDESVMKRSLSLELEEEPEAAPPVAQEPPKDEPGAD
jgi:hypothetical protein